MPYVLVLFRPAENLAQREELGEAHAEFITSLIRRNRALLGGDFGERIGDVPAAYLLRCATIAEARELVADDPFFRERVFRPELVEWHLVAINPEAIDADAAVRPADVGGPGDH